MWERSWSDSHNESLEERIILNCLVVGLCYEITDIVSGIS
jgi:hypothetical protein